MEDFWRYERVGWSHEQHAAHVSVVVVAIVVVVGRCTTDGEGR